MRKMQAKLNCQEEKEEKGAEGLESKELGEGF